MSRRRWSIIGREFYSWRLFQCHPSHFANHALCPSHPHTLFSLLLALLPQKPRWPVYRRSWRLEGTERKPYAATGLLTSEEHASSLKLALRCWRTSPTYWVLAAPSTPPGTSCWHIQENILVLFPTRSELFSCSFAPHPTTTNFCSFLLDFSTLPQVISASQRFGYVVLEHFWNVTRTWILSTAGNNVVATIFISLFFFVPVFLFPFPPSRPFLIEGVLGSKNLFSKSCLECPQT